MIPSLAIYHSNISVELTLSYYKKPHLMMHSCQKHAAPLELQIALSSNNRFMKVSCDLTFKIRQMISDVCLELVESHWGWSVKTSFVAHGYCKHIHKLIISVLRFITVFYGTGNISQNILKCFPHWDWWLHFKISLTGNHKIIQRWHIIDDQSKLKLNQMSMSSHIIELK